MSPENLTPEEREAVAQLLRRTINAGRFPLSPRLKPLKSALAKLDPQPEPAVEPLPPPRRCQQYYRAAEARQALGVTLLIYPVVSQFECNARARRSRRAHSFSPHA
jgi:hypothetical protein